MKVYKRTQNDPAPLGQPDPYMIRAKDGRYYLYATGGQIFSSDTLFGDWRYEGIGLTMPGQKNCWAPSVIELGEKYYMYYSSMAEDSEDEHGHTMRLAVSDDPKGRFLYQTDVLAPFSIDPHVVKTPSGLYIFYCNNDYEAQRAGTRIFCDKMSDPVTVEGRPVCTVWPTLDEEIYQKDRFRPGQHWHTIEGAFYFFKDGTHYLMYSGACYQNPTYFIGYCTAKGPEDADLRTLDWKKYPDEDTYQPLLARNAFSEGCGHNSVIMDQNDCYIVYHARDYEDAIGEEDTRSARIDQLIIDGEKLSVVFMPE